MNIVVYGTGGNAGQFFERILPVYNINSNLIKVIGVIDDNKRRRDSYFYGFKVGYLDDLKFYEEKMDYMLFLDSFHRLSYDQVKEDLKAKSDSIILSRVKLIRMINKSGFWMDKSVLLLGIRDEFDRLLPMAELMFKNHLYLETLPSQNAEKILNEYDFILLGKRTYASPISMDRYNRKLLIKSKMGIPENRILNWREWFQLLVPGPHKIRTDGSDNPDKDFLVLTGDATSGWANMLWLFSNALDYAVQNNMIPVVDMQNYITQYHSVNNQGVENVWETFFNPVSDYDLKSVYNSKNVYTLRRGYVARTNKLNSLIKFKDDIRKTFEEKRDMLFPKESRILGAVYRGSDYNIAYGHPHPINYSRFLRDIKRIMEKGYYQYVFIATEDKDFLDRIKKEFGNQLLYTKQKRVSYKGRSKRDKVLLADMSGWYEDSYEKSLDYLFVLYLLSKCDALYGGLHISSVSYARIASDYDYTSLIANPTRKDFREILDMIGLPVRNKIIRKIKRTLRIDEYSVF